MRSARTLAGAWLPIVAMVAGCAQAQRPTDESAKHRGMSYAHAWRRAEQIGYGTPASLESLRRLKALGVTWISITPFGFQRTPHDVAIRWSPSRFSETDERLRAVTRQAHGLGLMVMMKPHLWLRPPAWVGDVTHRDEESWATWFASYRAFLLHYVELAAELGIEALCVGNELDRTVAREREWRALIAEVRQRFPGVVTYGANASQAGIVPFWDALDYIGVSAYYPLVDEPTPDKASLVDAWTPIAADLERLSARWGRRVLFTELGYRSAAYGAWRHWELARDAPVDLATQALAYEAFFEAVWPRPWFAGVYWWKWFSHLADGGPGDNDFTPKGKPAEEAMAAGFAVR
jgi:hypothetical protein